MKASLLLLATLLVAPAPAHGTVRKGTLHYVVQDTIDDATGQVIAETSAWHIPRGKRHVTPVADDPRLVNGATVMLRGTLQPDGTLTPLADARGVTITALPPPTGAPTVLHEVVVPIRFADVDFYDPPATRAAILVDSAETEPLLWAAASYGHMTQTMTVLPTLVTPFRSTQLVCPGASDGLLAQEIVRLTAGQVDWSTVTTVDVVLPAPGGYGAPRYCPDPTGMYSQAPTGSAIVGPVVIPAFGTQPIGWEVNSEIWPLLMHETGHTLGFSHANLLDCGPDRGGIPADVSGCVNLEYGDGFDVMGSIGDLNALHKRQLGWIRGGSGGNFPQRYALVSSTGGGGYRLVGRWKLSALEDAATTATGGDLKMLGIPMLTAPGGWLTLEARFAEGPIEYFHDDNDLAGVLIHWAAAPVVIPPGSEPLSPWATLLVNPFPATHPRRWLLPVGESFDQWPWRITVTARDASASPKTTMIQVEDLRYTAQGGSSTPPCAAIPCPVPTFPW